MEPKLIGIDVAKNVFQVCVLAQDNQVISNRSVKRSKLLCTLTEVGPVPVYMETCPSANYWARQMMALGHEVRLLPAQHVKAFVRTNKTDRGDALAIAEAAQRPDIHCVRPKTLEQQDLQCQHRVRERLIRERTAVSNQLRGIAREYGVNFALGGRALRTGVPEALEDGDNELTVWARETLAALLDELRDFDERVLAADQRLQGLCAQNEFSRRLQRIPGVGPVVAAGLLAAVGDGHQFKNGRQLAAWAGLVPRQHGTGGKTRLLGITKNGDRSVRTLLIHGARAVMRWAHRRDDALGRWIVRLKERAGANRATVALANKLARIVWVVLAKGEAFDLRKACAST